MMMINSSNDRKVQCLVVETAEEDEAFAEVLRHSDQESC